MPNTTEVTFIARGLSTSKVILLHLDTYPNVHAIISRDTYNFYVSQGFTQCPDDDHERDQYITHDLMCLYCAITQKGETVIINDIPVHEVIAQAICPQEVVDDCWSTAEQAVEAGEQPVDEPTGLLH